MAKIYYYVGPEAIRARCQGAPAGRCIDSVAALQEWFATTGQEPDRAGLIAVTFVDDPDGRLRVADRHSEHVACAGGGPVLTAGEMFLRADAGEAVEVSNQSLGYCPEPESWAAVGAALDRAGIGHPGGFTAALQFRRCAGCGQVNVVKDSHWHCDVCGMELPGEWNLQAAPTAG